MNPLARSWRARGELRTLAGHTVFTVDIPPAGAVHRPPLLVLHGFPTSSFDFHRVVDRLAAHRRVLLFDMLGYGLSDKPDIRYTISAQADLARHFLDQLGVAEFGLLTHDVGDTVGGEILARQLEGAWDAVVTDRILTNGSIYVEMARLSEGQQLLLALPDERLTDDGTVSREAVVAGLLATFGPDAEVDPMEIDAQWELIAEGDGHRLLPRLIRYIEDRRRDEVRFTGAIEGHPSPLTVVWGGDDPIAVAAMVERLAEVRPGLEPVILDGIGHYPMVEGPDRFLAALVTTGAA